tara:strand:+ start:54 stop:518 length:465 start_codon:yes stop_codon:yes gene_type:complete
MARNKTGGKKHKRAKNFQNDNKIVFPEEGQYFAKVTKLLGSCRMKLIYYTKNNTERKIKDWNTIESIGIVRGSMVKRVFVNVDDIVLITPRDFEDKKVDIIHKYTENQLQYLKQHMELPNIKNKNDEDIEFDNLEFDDNLSENENDFDKNIELI